MQSQHDHYAVVRRLYAELEAVGYLADPAAASEVRVAVTPAPHAPDGYFLRLMDEVETFGLARTHISEVAGFLLHRVRGYAAATRLVLVAPDRTPAEAGIINSSAQSWWGQPVEVARITIGEACAAAEAAMDRGELAVPIAHHPRHRGAYPTSPVAGRWGFASYKLLKEASDVVQRQIAEVGGADLCRGVQLAALPDVEAPSRASSHSAPDLLTVLTEHRS